MSTYQNGFSALADPTRRAIFERLADGPRAFGESLEDGPPGGVRERAEPVLVS